MFLPLNMVSFFLPVIAIAIVRLSLAKPFPVNTAREEQDNPCVLLALGKVGNFKGSFNCDGLNLIQIGKHAVELESDEELVDPVVSLDEDFIRNASFNLDPDRHKKSAEVRTREVTLNSEVDVAEALVKPTQVKTKQFISLGPAKHNENPM